MTQAKLKPLEIPAAVWSLERYHNAIETGVIADWDVELLEGIITPVAPESPRHWYRGDKTSEYLKSALGSRAKVRFNAPITLSSTERNPDVAIVQPLDEEYEQHHPRPENIYWLIEVADSQPSRDLKDKQPIYARAGIKEYWVINLKQNELHVLRHPKGDRYTFNKIWTEPTISPLSFPDVILDVQKLLGDHK